MASQEENHLDNIFYTMGELKAFTIGQVFIFSMSYFPAAYQLLSNIFISQIVPHRCAPAPNNSTDLLVGLEDYNDNLTVFYDQCQIVVSHGSKVLRTESCIYGMEYDLPKDTSAVSQFDLVCEYKSLARLSQTLVIAGQGIGATFSTMVSDRIGRKPVVVFSGFGLMACGLIIAYAPNYTLFAIFKFFVGAFQQGSNMSSSTLLLEIFTTKTRRLSVLSFNVFWGMGCMSLALWAYVLRDYSWRTLQMVLSLFSLNFLIELWLGKESLRWLIANGKSKAIVKYIRHATKRNKTSFEKTMEAYQNACHLKEESQNVVTEVKATRKLTLVDILRMKRMLLNSVIMWFAWFTTALSFFAIYLSSTSLAGNKYLNFFLTAIMELVSSFPLYYGLNRCGRKVTLIGVFLVAGSCNAASGIFRSLEENTVNSAFALTFSCFAMAGSSAAFGFVYFYTPEIFPTNLRNQALGVSSLMGRVGGMIAPFTGVLSEKVEWGPGILIGGCALLVCLLSVFLPETRGVELPQTIEDIKIWFSKNKKNPTKIETKTDSSDRKYSLVM